MQVPATRHAWIPGLLAFLVVALPSSSRTDAADAEAPIVQLGRASWYGPGFHGKETASGEIFDQRDMVAAHRTLPLDSLIRVTNLENGRRLILRVNDRGPYGRNYRSGTILDVSHGAARRLDFIHEGIVEVRIEVLALGRGRHG